MQSKKYLLSGIIIEGYLITRLNNHEYEHV